MMTAPKMQNETMRLSYPSVSKVCNYPSGASSPTQTMTADSYISVTSMMKPTKEPAMTEDSVRAFLVDYYEDLNSNLTGTSRECWNAFYSKNHSATYKQIRPSGNPIDSEGLVDMLTAGDMVLHESSFVSVDSVTLMAGGKAAVVTYTADQCYTILGVTKDDRTVITAILEEIAGEVKMVHEHKSRGRPIPKLSRWSSTEPDESDVPDLHVYSGPKSSVREKGVLLREGESVMPLKGGESPLPRGEQVMPLKDGEVIMALKGGLGGSPKHGSRGGLRDGTKQLSKLVRTHSVDQMRRVDSDTMLRLPIRTRGMAVSSEVLGVVVKRGSSDRLRSSDNIRGCRSSIAMSTFNTEPVSRQENASWGLPIQEPGFGLPAKNKFSSMMTPSMKQQMMKEMSPTAMSPAAKRRSTGRKKILSAGARSSLLQDLKPHGSNPKMSRMNIAL